MPMPSESPILHFLRGTVLLIVLTAVPGIAVCWNYLPKNLFFHNQSFQNKQKTPEIPAETAGGIAGEVAAVLPDQFLLQNQTAPVYAAPVHAAPVNTTSVNTTSVHTDRRVPPNPSLENFTEKFTENSTGNFTGNAMGNMMKNMTENMTENPAANNLENAPENGSGKKTASKNYETMKNDLNTLGVKYSKIEKWGNQGELFRFSCLVSVADDSPNEKLFQDIGANEIEVMESVIADIKRWRNAIQNATMQNTTMQNTSMQNTSRQNTNLYPINIQNTATKTNVRE